MEILDNLIIVSLIVSAFFVGMKVDAHYRKEAAADLKDALGRQYLRLRAKADADDPCGPYLAPRATVPQLTPLKFNTGDPDGDGPITQDFMDELRANGRAKTVIRKSSAVK